MSTSRYPLPRRNAAPVNKAEPVVEEPKPKYPRTSEDYLDLFHYLRENNAKDKGVALCYLRGGSVFWTTYARTVKEPAYTGSVLLQYMMGDGGLRFGDLADYGAQFVLTFKADTIFLGMLSLFGVKESSVQVISGKCNWKNGKHLFESLKNVYTGTFVPDTRYFQLVKQTSPGLDMSLNTGDSHTGYKTVHRIYMMAAYILLHKRTTLRVPDGKYVGVIMVDKSGEIIGWGVNTNAHNATLHAEVNMIQSYYQRNKTGIPPGARIYSTLQCCAMCSGMIYDCCDTPDTVRVYYGMTDVAQQNKGTILGRAGMEILLTGEKGQALRGVTLGGGKDLAATINADFKTHRQTAFQQKAIPDDAATFGQRNLSKDVGAAFKQKVEKYSEDSKTEKVKNPNVEKAVKAVSAFLKSVGAGTL